MPGLSHIAHAPSPLGEDAHLTHPAESQARFCCRPCNREFGQEAFHQHILTSPMHLRTCCRPCRRNFCSEKDRFMHWGTAEAHRYTYDLWCNKNFENAESFLHHQGQCPQKHQVCKPCNIDFGPYELDLKKHLEEDGAHKDAYNRVCQIPLDGVKSFEHHHNKSTKHPICLLCNSNHPSPCHLAHNTLEEFGFLSSLGNETHLPASEPNRLNTSNGHRIISEVAEDILENPQARSAIVEYPGDTRDHFLHGPESPNSLALNEVMKQREYKKNSYCRICKVDFGTKILLKEHAVQHYSPRGIACFGCHEEKLFPHLPAMIAHLESGNCSAGLTRRHINSLVAEHAGSSAFVVKDSILFFLAGPPVRYTVEASPDSTARIWSCRLCRKSFTSRSQIKIHFLKVGCFKAYPNVLQCPESACTEGFTTFSALLQHVDMQHNQPLMEGPMADIFQYLKDRLGDPSVKEKLERIEFDMKFNCGKLSLTVSKDKDISQP